MTLLKEYGHDTEVDEDAAPRVPAKSFLAMQSLQFGGKKIRGRQRRGSKEGGRGRRASFGNSTTQYHSLAGSMDGRGQFPRKPKKRASSVEIPVMSMNVLKSSPLNTSPPVNC